MPQCQLRHQDLDLPLLLLGQPFPSQLVHLWWQPHCRTLPSGTPQLSTHKINSHSYKPLRICSLILSWSKRRWGTSSSRFTGLGLIINWLLCLGPWWMFIKVLLGSPRLRGSRDLRTYDLPKDQLLEHMSFPNKKPKWTTNVIAGARHGLQWEHFSLSCPRLSASSGRTRTTTFPSFY